MTGRALDALDERLAALEALFRRNVTEASRAWSKHIADEALVTGLSAGEMAAARENARARDREGLLLTLEAPGYDAILLHADDRSLRKELYEVHETRSSDRGPAAHRFDNGPVIDEILEVRHTRAIRRGFANHAELALERERFASTEELEHFLIDLRIKARPRAQCELEDVWRFARSQGAPKEFRPWDLPYWSEKLQRTRAEPDFQWGLRTTARLERAFFDLRVHRDYVPVALTSPLRSQVLDTLAQVRREVSVLPPPPWNRAASSFVDVFGGAGSGRTPSIDTWAASGAIDAHA
jgi:Zn-dependent oligopeptidase